MDYTQILEGMQAHPYATIILASVIEGKITAVIAGAFVTRGQVDPMVAYSIFVTMDVLGDTLYYLFGRIGHLLGTYFMDKIGWQAKSDRLHGGLMRNLPRTIWLAKITMVGSKPVIVTAGIAKMSFVKFYGVTIPCTLLSYLVCMGLGYFFCQLVL